MMLKLGFQQQVVQQSSSLLRLPLCWHRKASGVSFVYTGMVIVLHLFLFGIPGLS